MPGKPQMDVPGPDEKSEDLLVSPLGAEVASDTWEQGLLDIQAFLLADETFKRIEDAARRRRREHGSRQVALESIDSPSAATFPSMPVLPDAVGAAQASTQPLGESKSRECEDDIGGHTESIAHAPRSATFRLVEESRFSSGSSPRKSEGDAIGQGTFDAMEPAVDADALASEDVQATQNCVNEPLPPLHISAAILNESELQQEVSDTSKDWRPMRLGLPRCGDTPRASAHSTTEGGVDTAETNGAEDVTAVAGSSASASGSPVPSQHSVEGRHIRFIDVPNEQVESFQQFARDLANKAQLEFASANPYVQALEAHRTDIEKSSLDPYADPTKCSLASRLATEREDGLASLTSLNERPDESSDAFGQGFRLAWSTLCKPESQSSDSALDVSTYFAEDSFIPPTDAVVTFASGGSRDVVQENIRGVPEWLPMAKGSRSAMKNAEKRGKDANCVAVQASPTSEVGRLGKAIQSMFWSDV